MTQTIDERNWTPEGHLDAIIREREYATYDEEWDEEHIEKLTDETLAFLSEKTGIDLKHFRRDGIAAMARERIIAGRAQEATS